MNLSSYRNGLMAAGLTALSLAASAASSDTSFMQKAAAGGMAEVEMGKLGRDKGTSDAVKQFGARMVQDHSKANDELKGIANAKQVALPAGPDAKAKTAMEAMQAMSGPAFDKHYMEHMVADHHTDIALFEREAKSGKDADVRSFAEKTFPTLKEHLQQATQVQSSLK